VASGQYGFSSVNDTVRIVYSTFLRDDTAGSILFNSTQQSLATPNEQFALGGMGGDNLNTFTGSLTGTLIAGHNYRWTTNAFIQNFAFSAVTPPIPVPPL
jgi:hypothetical protein